MGVTETQAWVAVALVTIALLVNGTAWGWFSRRNDGKDRDDEHFGKDD